MKERLLVQRIRNEFLDKETKIKVAFIVGLRRVGKTTVLKQLNKIYTNSKYISIEESNHDTQYNYNYIIEELDNAILLIDEFTNLIEFDSAMDSLMYEIEDRDIKIIITGSSPYHLYKLKSRYFSSKNSILFKLPILTFTEYCYFTDRINSYSYSGDIKNEWFHDYLVGKDLETESVNFSITNRYIRNWAKLNDMLTRNSNSVRYDNSIEYKHIEALFNCIAYNTIYDTNYSSIIDPQIGGKEAKQLGYRYNKTLLQNFDLTNLLMNQSVEYAKKIDIDNVKNMLIFFIESGLATISTIDINTDSLSILKELYSCKDKQALNNLFNKIVIMLNSPLFYIPLGKEILDRFGATLDTINKGHILGLLVELYAVGALYNLSNDMLVDQYKLISIGPETNEVDIYMKSLSLMIEITIRNKVKDDINLDKYFMNDLLIRVCSSKTANSNTDLFHYITYGKLLYLLDTGHIMSLNKSDKNTPLGEDIFKSSNLF